MIPYLLAAIALGGLAAALGLRHAWREAKQHTDTLRTHENHEER